MGEMVSEYRDEPLRENYAPSHTPGEKLMGSRLSSIFKGSTVWVIPFSVKHGDKITAMAMNCNSYTTSLMEVSEPFQAYIEDYDGHFLKLRSDHYYCLKIDINEIKDLIPCTNGPEKND